MRSYVPAADLAWVDASVVEPFDEHVYLMRVPDGTPGILNGSAAMIFLSVLRGEDPVAMAADSSGLAVEEVAAQVQDFLEELVQQGFLIHTDGEAP